jgi:DNA-binding GntR family transcriptional regulator
MRQQAVQRVAQPVDLDPDLKRDAVYEQVLLDIICAELRPGERVDEIALAERYRAGRAGIRDTLYRLALEGLVERRPRLGTVVANPSVIELQQVFQLRVQIEGQCAALAARNARKDEIEAINRAFADADRAIAAADWRSVVRFDRAFHHAMAAAAHNVWLERTLLTLHNSALRFWHYALPRRPVDAVKGEIAGHLEVAAAIAARDPAGAQAAMRTVLGEFPATVQGLFSDALEPLA